MPANVDGMVREGISAYRAGRKEEARALLLRAVEIDQYNEQAWLWLSAVVESTDEQRTCLENVLMINPNNERAQQGLQMLTQKSAPPTSAKSSSAQADDVLASTSFTAPPPPPLTAPVDDELPSSIEWDAPPTESSSASSTRRVNEPSPGEYDDWVSNLNLGGAANKNNTLDAASQFMATPSYDDDDDDDLFSARVTDDDDLFSSGPFSAPETPLPKSQPEFASRPAPLPASDKQSSPGRGLDSLLDEIEDDEDEVDTTGFFDDDDDDNFELDKLDASEFFQYIPKEIKATRLPGTRERYPAVVIIGLLAFFLLNIGAVALLVTNLTAQ